MLVICLGNWCAFCLLCILGYVRHITYLRRLSPSLRKGGGLVLVIEELVEPGRAGSFPMMSRGLGPSRGKKQEQTSAGQCRVWGWVITLDVQILQPGKYGLKSECTVSNYSLSEKWLCIFKRMDQLRQNDCAKWNCYIKVVIYLSFLHIHYLYQNISIILIYQFPYHYK